MIEENREGKRLGLIDWAHLVMNKNESIYNREYTHK